MKKVMNPAIEIRKSKRKNTALIEDMGKVPVGNCKKCAALCGNVGHPMTVRCTRFIPKFGLGLNKPKKPVFQAAKSWDNFYKELGLEIKVHFSPSNGTIVELFDTTNKCTIDCMKIPWRKQKEIKKQLCLFMLNYLGRLCSYEKKKVSTKKSLHWN